MKIALSFLLACLSFYHPLSAQKLVKIIYMKDGIITTRAHEANTMTATRLMDGLYQRNDYINNGPLKKVRTFKDIKQTILEGQYLEYDSRGHLQVAGYYTNNEKTGTWFYFKDSGNLVKTEYFRGPGVFEEAGNDSTTAPVFRSGKNEWMNYLQKKFNRDLIPDRLKDQKLQLSFSITALGKVTNLVLMKSTYFQLDNEIIRTISSSPKWKPAIQHGKRVSYRYLQTLVFYDLFNGHH